MPEQIKRTALWNNSLGVGGTHAERLANAFLTARRNVGDLLVGIPGDMKGYTVHDLTHLDALWEIADLIAGPDFRLNPAEAFVFGISVLLHDAGMSVMAFPGGIDEVTGTEVWSDQARSFGVSDQDASQIPAGIKAAILTSTLRALHASRAEKLATQSWTSGNRHFHLIEDDDLRVHYGPLAGRVAHSHHWDAGTLPAKFASPLGAFGGMPADWTVDGVKVATLLRCADAAHIDHRRAPRRLLAMTRPEGVSQTHWNFQTKLAKPFVREGRLHYSSTEPFDVPFVDAWYLCFDTAQMVDRELSEADENLRMRGLRFAVTGVQGAKSVGQFCESVHTLGWKPVGVDVQVSDVPALAKSLGGEALYSSKFAPIRELLQNAADSIDARILIDSGFNREHGKIVVRLTQQTAGWRLDVEDNGIGMSERILTRALLDFGKSFWRSELVRDEYPSMRGGFQESRGKFGIGFFSVFMWSSKVSVTSRKFTDAQDDTMVLEFLGGITQRPILRSAHAREKSSTTITRVSLEITDDVAQMLLGKSRPAQELAYLRRRAMHWGRPGDEFEGRNPLQKMIAALEIDVVFEAEGKKRVVNNRNWSSLEGKEFIEYFSQVCGDIDAEIGAPSVSEIIEGGIVRGRALLVPQYMRKSDYVGLLIHDKGITISIDHRRGVFGVLEGQVANAARDRAEVGSPSKNAEWMAGQQTLIFLGAPDNARQIAAQKLLVDFGRFSPDQTLFVMNREMLSLTAVLDRIAAGGRVDIRVSEESDGRFAWKEVKLIEVIVGVEVNPNRLYTLCDLPVEGDDDTSIEELFLGSNQDTVAGQIFSEIGRVLGPDPEVTIQFVDQDTYSRRKDAYIRVGRR